MVGASGGNWVYAAGSEPSFMKIQIMHFKWGSCMLGFLLTHDGEMASVLLALEHGAMCKNRNVLS